jgi:hypothetical protein
VLFEGLAVIVNFLQTLCSNLWWNYAVSIPPVSYDTNKDYQFDQGLYHLQATQTTLITFDQRYFTLRLLQILVRAHIAVDTGNSVCDCIFKNLAIMKEKTLTGESDFANRGLRCCSPVNSHALKIHKIRRSTGHLAFKNSNSNSTRNRRRSVSIHSFCLSAVKRVGGPFIPRQCKSSAAH